MVEIVVGLFKIDNNEFWKFKTKFKDELKIKLGLDEENIERFVINGVIQDILYDKYVYELKNKSVIKIISKISKQVGIGVSNFQYLYYKMLNDLNSNSNLIKVVDMFDLPLGYSQENFNICLARSKNNNKKPLLVIFDCSRNLMLLIILF